MKTQNKLSAVRAPICLLISLLMAALCIGGIPAQAQAGEERETLEDIYNGHSELDPFTDPEKFAEKFGLNKEGDLDPKELDYFYYYRQFYVTLTEANVYDVTEIVDVYFANPQSGITRTLPRYDPVADINNVKTFGYPKYSGIYSDEPYKVTESGEDLSIFIGGSDLRYKGFKQFRLHYTLDLGPDSVSGRDEALIYLITPSADRPTLRTVFEIKMPKAFDESGVNVVCSDKSYEGIVTYSVDENTIKGETNYHTNSGRALVVRITLPEGYFSDAKYRFDTPTLICLAAGALMTVCCVIIYLLSRSRSKPSDVIASQPPNELNPVEAAYLKFGRLDDKKIPLLLPYLASRGCFKVMELSKGNTGKLDRSSCSFSFEKSDELPGMHTDERMFIDGMFAHRRKDDSGRITVSDGELRGGFYTTLRRIGGHYENDKTSVCAHFFPFMGRHMRLVYRAVLCLLASVGIALPISYSGTGSSEKLGITAFCFTAALIAGVLFVMGLFKKPIKAAISAAAIGAAVYFMPVSEYVYYPRHIAAFGVLCLALILNFFSGDIKTVRTRYGKKLYDRLVGFERFMQACDTGGLKALCEQNGDSLYNMLPYAKALDVPLPRPKALEKEYLCNPPSWYIRQNDTGGFTYYNMTYFYDTVREDLTYVPSGAASFDISLVPPEILGGLKKP
ncbi:MAG: DUF2207 domain-containing protein [Ruminococcus sp.]|nr:DUF2207 domain-containing protein [Ruminococcus sp.]